MIFEILQIITEDVSNYFGGNLVSLDNIASVVSEQGDSGGTSTDIILTLLNLQEETTLKNRSNYSVTGTSITNKNQTINPLTKYGFIEVTHAGNKFPNPSANHLIPDNNNFFSEIYI